MDTSSTDRSARQGEAERLQQEQSFKIRDIQKRNHEEMEALTQKHESDMKVAEAAFRVELNASKEEFQRKMDEMNSVQAQRLATLATQNEGNLKQAQDTYKAQADQLRMQGEKRLNVIREEQKLANENIEKKGKA